MFKVFSIILFAGAVSAINSDSARACGGGGGGCGMSGGGMAGGGYRGGIRPASSKALGSYVRTGAPTIRARAPSGVPGAPASLVAAGRRPTARPAAARTANAKPASVTTKPAIYTCPMHPQIQWPKSIDCPICGMKLKLKAARGPGKYAPNQSASSAEPMVSEADDAAMDDMPGMNMPGMDEAGDMNGMDDMKMCPGCMGGMSGMRGSASPKASRKVNSRGRRSMGGMAGMGCGC